jgi:hypothetical protein
MSDENQKTAEKEYLYSWLKAANKEGYEYFCKVYYSEKMYLKKSNCLTKLQYFISNTISTIQKEEFKQVHEINIEIRRINSKLAFMLSESPIIARGKPEQF